MAKKPKLKVVSANPKTTADKPVFDRARARSDFGKIVQTIRLLRGAPAESMAWAFKHAYMPEDLNDLPEFDEQLVKKIELGIVELNQTQLFHIVKELGINRAWINYYKTGRIDEKYYGLISILNGNERFISDSENIAAQLRENFEQFQKRRKAREELPEAHAVKRVRAFTTVHEVGMSPSAYIRDQFKMELENGTFLLSDVRPNPENPRKNSRLYKALAAEAKRKNIEPAALIDPAQILKSETLSSQSREALAALLGVSAEDPYFNDWISSINRHHLGTKGR